jgi:hypothetical protein
MSGDGGISGPMSHTKYAKISVISEVNYELEYTKETNP